MQEEFESHRLNVSGLRAVREIGGEFDRLLGSLRLYWGTVQANPRCMAIVRSKLEEACFYAKKAIAMDPAMQEGEQR
jgi:hypothetical protein